MKESLYQHSLIKRLKKLLPGCVVLKTDASYIQGFPDLLILYGARWAALECKASLKAAHRPNQDYYISKLAKMGFASFIAPENERTVLDELLSALRVAGTTRVSKPKQLPLASIHSGKAS